MLSPKLSILSKVWLDLIFDGRNKLYGAYIIRKNAQVDLSRALLLGTFIFALMILVPLLLQRVNEPDNDARTLTDPVTFAHIPPIKQHEAVVPVLSKPISLRSHENKVRMRPPKVVEHDLAIEEPPTIAALKNAAPGPKTLSGDPTVPITIDAPISDVGQLDAITAEGGESSVFVGVEIPPTFPGGMKTFLAYIAKNYHYPTNAKEQRLSGKLILTFIVERDGSLTDIEIIRDLGLGTGEEAVRLLKNAPKWKPGIQNGRTVRVRYQLPIALQIQ